MQATIRNGTRCDTATAYLDPVRDHTNLTILKEAMVTRVLIENGRAIAVDYLENGQTPRRIHAASEIVISAGSIGSPHLLMLSGIGPADHLADQGIDVILDNPDVGAHLEDHYSQDGVFRRLKEPEAVLGALPETFEAAVEEFQKTGGGWLATMQVDAVAFHSVDPGSAYPQFQSIFRPAIPDVFRTSGRLDRAGVALGGYICRPRSQGTVRLVSSNPLDAPPHRPQLLLRSRGHEADDRPPSPQR